MMNEMIRKIKEQRKLLRDIDKRTMERMEIMRSFDETNEKKKIERRRRIDRDDDHMENSDNMTQYDEKKQAAKVQRTFFDVRTAARLSALRSRLVSKVGG
eukprot:g1363.t1